MATASHILHGAGLKWEAGRKKGCAHLEHIEAHPEVCTHGSHLQQSMVCFQVELEVSGLELLP